MSALTQRSLELVLARARDAAAHTSSACDALGAFLEVPIRNREWVRIALARRSSGGR